ncbi:DNRLRE domain-containing protein [Aeromicrobium halocynthiae]
MPGNGRNANRAGGGASELSEALDAARRSKEPVPVDALQSETEEFIANPDGTITREIAQSPVRVKTGDDWVDVDPGLRRADGRLKPKAGADDVTFSDDGDGPLAELKIGKNRIGLAMPGVDLETPSVDGAQATYPVSGGGSVAAADPGTGAQPEAEAEPDAAAEDNAAPTPSTAPETVGEKVLVAVKNGGFAAHVLLDAAPAQAPEYVFDLTAGNLTPELIDNRLVLSDADGEPVAQSMPLRMWDAQVDEAGDPSNVADVDASLDRTAEGWRLTLRPSMDFLTADDTEYPVVVDPDIAEVTHRGDVFFRDGTDANTNFAGEPRIEVGRNSGALNRGFLGFAFNPYLGATVTKAELRLHQYFARDCTPRQLNLHSMTSADRTGATWNTQPNHTTDARFTASKSFSRGSSGCGAGAEIIDVTNVVNGWAGRHVGTHSGPFGDRAVVGNRQAFIARAANESSIDFYKRFCSEEWSSTLVSCTSAAVVPRLSVTFEPEIGEQSWYSMTERELDDRATLKVNNKNANLVLQSADMNVKGLGLDLAINRTYNSQSTETGPMGRGWSLNIGPDIWLEKKSQYRYDFHTPGGTILGSFVRRSANSSNADYKKFFAPVGGVGAELEETDNGFTLTFRQSQEKYVFNQVNGDGHAFMTKVRDRSDNEITIAYSGTAGAKPRMTSITDSADRVYTPTYTGNLITRWATQNLTGAGTRQVNYTYSGDYLASATDATNVRTDYAYTSPSSGPRLLSTITAAVNDSGARPTTHITYSNGDGQVATVGYRHGNGTNDVHVYSWNLNSSRVAACDGNGCRASRFLAGLLSQS